jgi:hypothetical protein
MRAHKFIVFAALATAMLASAAVDANGQRSYRTSATLNSDAFGQAPTWRSSGGQTFFDRWSEDVILQSGDVDFRAGYLRELQNDIRNCNFSPVSHHTPEGRHYVLTAGECSWEGQPYQVTYAVRWELENVMALKCISFVGRTPSQTTEFGLAEKGFYRGGASPLTGINRRMHAARSCTEDPLQVTLNMSHAWFVIGAGINAGRMRQPSALDMCLSRCQPLDPERQDRNACYESCFRR